MTKIENEKLMKRELEREESDPTNILLHHIYYITYLLVFFSFSFILLSLCVASSSFAFFLLIAGVVLRERDINQRGQTKGPFPNRVWCAHVLCL